MVADLTLISSAHGNFQSRILLLQPPLKLPRFGCSTIGCANGSSLCVALEKASLGKRLKMPVNVLC